MKQEIRYIPEKTTRKHQKQRVAAYCRVSTKLASQADSIRAQRSHYERLIREQEEWEPAGIYIEMGRSGTKRAGRTELQRMLKDCKAGRIDLILTKSVSRFARNAEDCLELVRALRKMGVELFFEKEGIHTGSMESELMLSIMAVLAENESRSISENVKWGIRKRFASGSYRPSCVPYGYRSVQGGFCIEEQEAEVVRRLFEEAAKGVSAGALAEKLNTEGIPSRRDREWSGTAVRAILKNRAYIGELVCQKTYTDEAYVQKRNCGELAQYCLAGHHEAIVSAELFERAGRR